MKYFVTIFITLATIAVVLISKKEEIVEVKPVEKEEIVEVKPTYCEVIDCGELTIIYPNFSKIDLVCDEMPTQEDESVIFVAEAAYTHDLLNEFKHSNIEGDHVSGGVRYKGKGCESNTGAFVYYNGAWKFCYDNYSYELDLAAENGGAGFGQEMIIYNGEIKQTVRKDEQKNQFRALCEIGGRLCIADSNSVVTFGDFKQLLKAQNATNAIYLDMGDGWNHSWYRTNEGVVELHPKTHNYCTNWITFYK